MRSPSDRRFGSTAIVVLIAVPLLLGAVRVTGQVIVTETDTVAEDLYAFAERVIIDGVVEGDLIVVSGGSVGRNVTVRVDELSVGRFARVGGDVVYEGRSDARVSEEAEVEGALVRRTTLAPVLATAIGRVLGVLSLFAFVVAGMVLHWLFRGSSSRAVEVAATRPGRAAAVGGGMLLIPPILVVPLFFTLVGIPVALVLLFAWGVALFLGPLPAVTTAGTRMLSDRGGPAAGLVVGAVVAARHHVAAAPHRRPSVPRFPAGRPRFLRHRRLVTQERSRHLRGLVAIAARGWLNPKRPSRVLASSPRGGAVLAIMFELPDAAVWGVLRSASRRDLRRCQRVPARNPTRLLRRAR
jgi:hypothetical protein